MANLHHNNTCSTANYTNDTRKATPRWSRQLTATPTSQTAVHRAGLMELVQLAPEC